MADEHLYYVKGRDVRIRPTRAVNPDGASSITLGGTIAEAQDEETAAEIAHVLNSHAELLLSLKESVGCLRYVESAAPELVGWSVRARCISEAQAVIAKADADTAAPKDNAARPAQMENPNGS